MTSSVKIDQPIPEFALPATNDRTIASADLNGHNTVVYFYPKDSTPGCTLESQGFRDAMADFAACNTVIFGVSRDSLHSHENFRSKQCLLFDLISDDDEVLCQLFGVIRMKNMYGKQIRGIERSTFLIDREGVLRREWRKVKVDGHVAEVLAAAQALG